MEFFEVLGKRRSTRAFTKQIVPYDLIEKLLYAARRAPAAGNRSTREFLVVNDPKTLKIIKAVAPGYSEAPLLLAICSNPSRGLDMAEWRKNYLSAFDVGCAAENIALAATSLGLGTCFVKAFSEVAVKRVLAIPDEIRLDILISVGFPDTQNAKGVKREPEPAYINRYGNTLDESP